MGKTLTLLLALSSFAIASEQGSDIVQRTVNFLLFAGILWYLLADPVKNYFTGRSNAIAESLNSVQNKLNESIQRKKDALAKISDAEKTATEIIEAAKKESKILNDSILAQCEADIENLEKAQQSKLELEQRKMIASVVQEVLEEVMREGSSDMTKDAMVNVILKKVA